MEYKIVVTVFDNINFDPKNKSFKYSVPGTEINGNCDTAIHAFQEACQRLQEYNSSIVRG